jgi:hypothetical protein
MSNCCATDSCAFQTLLKSSISMVAYYIHWGCSPARFRQSRRSSRWLETAKPTASPAGRLFSGLR